MTRTFMAITVVCLTWPLVGALAHTGHRQDPDEPEPGPKDGIQQDAVALGERAAEAPPSPRRVSGQGSLKFRVLHTSDHLPALARSVIEKAHGGFAVDRRQGRGEIYFALPEAGIVQISRDLEVVRMLNTPQEVRETNMHNATIWYDTEGNGYLTFPANDAGKVFTTSLDGSLKHALGPPTSETTFEPDAVNEYFRGDGKFVPTDVEYMDGSYFVTTGYSSLDYVLTAEVSVMKPEPAAQNIGQTAGSSRHPRPLGPSVLASWLPAAFGGKGTGPGQFGTGHGVTLLPNRSTLVVADRPNSELDRFSLGGTYADTVKLPEGSWPCDVDFAAGYAVVGCLHGPDRSKGAPIYILRGDRIVSTIMPKEDLGLENFQHVHNAVLIEREGRLFIIAQAWNPGDFTILEQVTD